MIFNCVCPVPKWGGAWCVLCKVLFLFLFICVTDLSYQISVACWGSLPETPGLVHLHIVPGPEPCPCMVCGTKGRASPTGASRSMTLVTVFPRLAPSSHSFPHSSQERQDRECLSFLLRLFLRQRSVGTAVRREGGKGGPVQALGLDAPGPPARVVTWGGLRVCTCSSCVRVSRPLVHLFCWKGL